MPVLLAIDVSNLVYRVYHATAASTPEDRLLAFARARLRRSVAALLRDVEPLRFVAAFDGPSGSFRDALLPDYKAGRNEKPTILSQLLTEAAELFSELGAECLYSPGHEADDVLATVADQCLAVGGWRVVMVSNDADSLACIHDAGDGSGVFVLRNKDGGYQLWGPEEVLASPKFGVPPTRVELFKALSGDKSDNVKGVPGIGPVAARRLASKYPNVKRLFHALGDPHAFTKAERAKLEAFGVEQALLMERVVKLVRSAPLARFA